MGGELAQHLSSTVAPLTIHDLPAVLWWPDDAPFGSPVFADLADGCDRILVDSGGFRSDGVASLAGMADAVASGHVVHDIAWMRLELWRELLAGLFDHPLLRPELRRLTSIRVDVARPGSTTHLTRAALFLQAGWGRCSTGC
ncbi:MAG: glucose-6-phosphate dehydrogenase assembly protein OpcA [Chloroflexota bacterium]